MANVDFQGAVPTPPKYQQGENYVLHDPNITQSPAYYKELLAGAKQSIRILDSYAFQHDAIRVFESVCSEGIVVEIITLRYDQEDLKKFADEIENILKRNIRQFTLNIISYRIKLAWKWKDQEIKLWHDRYLIIDNSEYYLVGNSLDGQQSSDRYHGIYHLVKPKDIDKVAKLYKHYQESYNAIRGSKITRQKP